MIHSLTRLTKNPPNHELNQQIFRKKEVWRSEENMFFVLSFLRLDTSPPVETPPMMCTRH